MPVFFLVFEFLGTTELLVIAAVALLIFGPRKLPEIGRTIGRSLAEFKRASEDFKRTWEYEVEMERSERETRAVQTDAPAAPPALTEGGAPALSEAGDGGGDVSSVAPAAAEEYTVARGVVSDATPPVADYDGYSDDARLAASHDAAAERHAEESSAAGGKKDWL